MDGVRFLLDPDNHSNLEKRHLDINGKNKIGRSPMMLCFTPLHQTASAKGQKALEEKPEPGWKPMPPGVCVYARHAVLCIDHAVLAIA